jgi:WD40 repeat protein
MECRHRGQRHARGAGWPRKSGLVSFSGDGKVIAKDRDSGTGFDLWSVATGQVLAVVDHSACLPGQLSSLAGIGPDGSELLTVSSSGDAQNEVWRISY